MSVSFSFQMKIFCIFLYFGPKSFCICSVFYLDASGQPLRLIQFKHKFKLTKFGPLSNIGRAMRLRTGRFLTVNCKFLSVLLQVLEWSSKK